MGTGKHVVFVVDSSSALSGVFSMLLTNYVVPCVEYFNGGFVENIEFSKSSCANSYGIVTINPSPLFSVPSCDYWPITNNSKTLLQYFRNIRFEGGLIEHCCRASDGLAAALEFLDLMRKFDLKNDQIDNKLQEYCIFITNLPPSPMPVVESLKFGGMSYLQLADHMRKNDINLSIVSPRWLAPYKELFIQGCQSVDITVADHGLHPGCMVLLHGFELNGLKAEKVKNDPDSTTQEFNKPYISLSPSVYNSQTTPSSVPQSSINTPSPGQMSELPTTTLAVDKSPLAKTSSASSLTEPYPWIHSNSPKLSSNPASVGSIPITSTSLSYGLNDVSTLPVSHISSPQSVSSPQTVTSLHQPLQQSLSFPLQSSTFNSSLSQFPALSAHDPLGSMSNPIQITSPGADTGLNFHVSSSTSTHSLASLMSPTSSITTSASIVMPVTSPPFGFTSSLSSSMASQIDIASISSSLQDSQSMPTSVSNISNLLMSNSSPSNQSVRSNILSQTPTPPPPSTTQAQGAAAVAAQILMQATLQASKPNPVGLGLSLPTGVSSANTFPPITSSSVTSSFTIGATPVTGQNATGTATHTQVVGNTQPLQVSQMPNAPQATLVPGSIHQTQVWAGILEMFEPRANNQKQSRHVQCSIHVSKPDTTQEIKPDLWPNKLSMSIHNKILFNSFTMFFRNNHSHLRTVHFQFLERPENVVMLRALMNNEPPQNKKIGIVQLNGASQHCPIKAFFIICQERLTSKHFTGLIPLDQEQFITTLKQALTTQRQIQPQNVQRAGLPSSLVSANPLMSQHITQAGTASQTSTQLMSGVEGQHTFPSAHGSKSSITSVFLPGQQQHPQGQQQIYSSMSSQNNSFFPAQSQQLQYSMPSGTSSDGTILHQQPVIQQQVRPLMQVGEQKLMGGQQQIVGNQHQVHVGGQRGQPQIGVQQTIASQQQVGGQLAMGGQQLNNQAFAHTSSAEQRMKQVFDKVPPEQRQMLYAKLEQQRVAQQMRQQLQQQQHAQQLQQQGQQHGNVYGIQQSQQQHMQPSSMDQSQIARSLNSQLQTPPVQQLNTQQPTGGNSGTLDFFQSF